MGGSGLKMLSKSCRVFTLALFLVAAPLVWAESQTQVQSNSGTSLFGPGPGIPGPAQEKSAFSTPQVPLAFDGVLYEPPAVPPKAEVIQQEPQVVFPEVPTRIVLSNVDVNRLRCETGPVRDVIYSREKGVSVVLHGSDVFVKYQVAVNQATGDKQYVTVPTDLYVVCGDQAVYQMVAVPQRVPAQTVVLRSRLQDIKKQISLFEGVPFEKGILNLIKWAYRDEIPDAFTVIRTNQPFASFEDVELVLVRVVEAEGLGLRLKEYIVTSKKPMRVTEKTFLLPAISRAPLALALTGHELGQKPVRLFVVERRENK